MSRPLLAVAALAFTVTAFACGQLAEPGGDPPGSDGGADGEGDGDGDGHERPARPDGGGIAGMVCATDDFDDALASHWKVIAGSTPVYTIDTALHLSETAAVVSLSMPPNAWIYDPDTDRGNQLAWEQAIGGADFTLEFDASWSSTLSEFTLAGIGLVNADRQLELYAGVSDGRSDTHGLPFVRLRQPGADLQWNGVQVEPGMVSFRLERIDGQIAAVVDGAQVLSGNLAAPLTHVVIFSQACSNGQTTFSFGTFDLHRVEICAAR